MHLREIQTGELVGVALLVPSERYAATLVNGADEVRERKLTPAAWREIDKWVMDGDVGPPRGAGALAPCSPVLPALLENERPTIGAHRFASFPMKARGEGALDFHCQASATPVAGLVLAAARSLTLASRVAVCETAY